MNEDSFHKLSNNMNQFFSTVGYPSTIRYVPNKKDPISFLQNSKYVGENKVCDELIKDAKEQFPLVKLNMITGWKQKDCPELLKKTTTFC